MTATSPDHYKNHPARVEGIDVVRYLPCPVANVIKYLWRWEKKDGVQDLEKALVYLNWIDAITIHQVREIPTTTPAGYYIQTATVNLGHHLAEEAQKVPTYAQPHPDLRREDPLYLVLRWMADDCDDWGLLYAAETKIREKITALKGDQP